MTTEYPPKEFCKQLRCIHYNLIERLESVKPRCEPTNAILGITRVYCQQRCERTAYQLFEWIKNNLNLS